MKSAYKKLFATCALLGLTTAAHAQLYTSTGINTGVTASLNFTINPILNQVSVQVSNTQPGVGGITGTVTSFGFNIPTALMGTGSLLSYSGVPAGTWMFFAPYDSSGFEQDVGAGSGNNANGGQPNNSIGFGSTATFLFQFADFSNATGFLGANGVSVRWQAVGANNNLSDRGFGNPGTPGGPGLTPVPEASTYGLFGAATLLAGVLLRRRANRNGSTSPAPACVMA